MVFVDIFLVLSNIAFLWPSIEQFQRYHYTRASIFFILIFASGTYHLCDSSLNTCILPIGLHHNLDFFFSQLVIPVTALSFILWSPKHWYLDRLLIISSALAIFLIQVLVDTAQGIVQLSILGVALLIILGAIPHNYDKLHWNYVLAAFVFTVGSFSLFYFGPVMYWLVHSIWHILSAVGQAMFARIKDSPIEELPNKDCAEYLVLDEKIVRNRYHGIK